MIKLKKTALILKALAHETRLAILYGLLDGDGCNVSRIVETLNVPQPTISQHIAVLKSAGIIEGYKKGSEICYKVKDKLAIKLLAEMEVDYEKNQR